MKVLVIVDVQKEFNKFIQHDLVDELYDYARKFKQVYQIWDTHKTDVAPTYVFPNQVDAVKKKYGKNHFSDKVQKFIKDKTDETFEGNLFKLSDEEGYIVRVDNNHDWFYVNPEIVQLIQKLKDDQVILTGGADNECLEDVYQSFKAFGLNVHINKKYVYSAKTDQNDSVDDIVNESYDERYIINQLERPFVIRCKRDLTLQTEDFILRHSDIEWRKSGKERMMAHRLVGTPDSPYIFFVIYSTGALSWCTSYFTTNAIEINTESDLQEKLGRGNVPDYKPKRIERTLESFTNKYKHDIIVIQAESEADSVKIQELCFENDLSWFGCDKTIKSIYDRYPIYYYIFLNTLDCGQMCLDNDLNYYVRCKVRENIDPHIYTISEYQKLNGIFKNGSIGPSYKPRKVDRTLEKLNLPQGMSYMDVNKKLDKLEYDWILIRVDGPTQQRKLLDILESINKVVTKPIFKIRDCFYEMDNPGFNEVYWAIPLKENLNTFVWLQIYAVPYSYATTDDFKKRIENNNILFTDMTYPGKVELIFSKMLGTIIDPNILYSPKKIEREI